MRRSRSLTKEVVRKARFSKKKKKKIRVEKEDERFNIHERARDRSSRSGGRSRLSAEKRSKDALLTKGLKKKNLSECRSKGRRGGRTSLERKKKKYHEGKKKDLLRYGKGEPLLNPGRKGGDLGGYA